MESFINPLLDEAIMAMVDTILIKFKNVNIVEIILHEELLSSTALVKYWGYIQLKRKSRKTPFLTWYVYLHHRSCTITRDPIFRNFLYGLISLAACDQDSNFFAWVVTGNSDLDDVEIWSSIRDKVTQKGLAHLALKGAY